MCFKIYRQTKFHPHRTTSGEDMTSYQFSRWQPWWRSTTSGFPIVEKVKFYHQTKCRRHSSIYGWDITSFVLEKETSAILEFYSRLWFRLYHRKRHVILHQRSKYHLYRTTHCGNITSYRFFKMAAAAAQYYFRFRVCSCCCLQKAKMYQQAKFRPHLNSRLRYNYFRFGKQTSAILKVYFRFHFRPTHRNRLVNLREAAEFHPHRTTHGGLLLLVCVSLTIIGQPRNSVLIRRV